MHVKCSHAQRNDTRNTIGIYCTIYRGYICTKDQLKINTNYGSSITANVGVFPGLPFVVIAFKRTCDKVSNADHAPNCYIITWLFSIVVVVVASVIIITVAINWKIITSTKSAAHNISLTIERDTIPCLCPCSTVINALQMTRNGLDSYKSVNQHLR